MSKAKEKNCRLCLQLLDDEYIVIEGRTRKIFEILVLNVDLSICEEPVLCKSCMDSVQEAFDFTSTSISVDELVLSLATDRNSGELDITDVYLKKNENKSLAFNEGYNVCRFCLCCLEKSNFNLLSNLKENSTHEMLVMCIPELDLNIIKDPVICTACVKSLESYYNLKMKCRNTEENIMKYCEVQGTECNGQISLNNILKFLTSCTPEYVDECGKIAVLKKKDNLFQNKGDTYSDINNTAFKIEEEIVIKDENKYEDCKSDENRCGETGQAEVVQCDKLACKDSLNVVTYRCEKCKYETERKMYLKRHMIIHKDKSELTMHKCNLCSYESKFKCYLKRHMLSHKNPSEIVMYNCERCTFKTKYRHSLKKHVLIHENNPAGPMHKCYLCGYEVNIKKYLRRHIMLTHRS